MAQVNDDITETSQSASRRKIEKSNESLEELSAKYPRFRLEIEKSSNL